jgi:CheY-like chemotaxis protein
VRIFITETNFDTEKLLNTSSISNVLSIEDDDDVVKVLSILLQGKANVVNAKTLREASQMLQSQAFDLIILDLHMPDGIGTSLLPCINIETGENIPVIVFSIDELDQKYMPYVEKSLLKSIASNEQIFEAIDTAIRSGKNK